MTCSGLPVEKEAPSVMLQSTVTPAKLSSLLERFGAKKKVHEVHALYLGALSSTSVRLGPSQLYQTVVGREGMIGASVEGAEAAMGILNGYWNGMVDQREAGKVGFLTHMPSSNSQSELSAFATRRAEELGWYVGGLEAEESAEEQFGPLGEKMVGVLLESRELLQNYGELLATGEALTEQLLCEARQGLVSQSEQCEALIAKLMDLGNDLRAVRVKALEQAREGTLRFGRNQPCPCGSGKKWKRCCGKG